MGFLERLGFKAKRKALPKNSGYGNYGASYARKSLSAWVTAGRSADEDIVDNIETLRERSRDLFMGSPLATGALKLQCGRIYKDAEIQVGPRHRADRNAASMWPHL